MSKVEEFIRQLKINWGPFWIPISEETKEIFGLNRFIKKEK